MQHSHREYEDRQAQMEQALQALEQVRQFQGQPQEFWPAFLEVAAKLAGARFGFLLVQQRDEESWRTVSLWPQGGVGEVRKLGIGSLVERIAETSSTDGRAWTASGMPGSGLPQGIVVGMRLDLADEERRSVMVFFVEGLDEDAVMELLVRLRLVSDIPVTYTMNRMALQARHDVVQFSEALDFMVILNGEKKFMAAAMALCNEMAARYNCQRVSLGWIKDAYVRVQAISHLEQFEKKMDSVQELEAAMEEAFDQDEEIIYPRPEGAVNVVRDHESYCRSQGVEHMISLPIRVDEEPLAVLSCERTEPFSEIDARGLRVICDQAARRVADLKKHDRWFGARAVSSAREGLSWFLGVEHTFPKLMGLILMAVLAFGLFGSINYRVEGTFILRTDDLAFVPAPFEGYIRDVHVDVGDLVSRGDPLLSLDTRELLLEESNALANRHRYSREAEKARAQNALADMRIAQAMVAQAEAQLALVRHHLDNARIRAPFDGIVVEGDLRELLGAPVRKGDVLFKVARLAELYAEIEVKELNIHDIEEGLDGEIAFVSRPELKFPLHVERVDPVALSKEEGNMFLIKGTLQEDHPFWWRPGMSGVAKINAGKRNVLWIVTHRTVDFFRMLLWW